MGIGRINRPVSLPQYGSGLWLVFGYTRDELTCSGRTEFPEGITLSFTDKSTAGLGDQMNGGVTCWRYGAIKQRLHRYNLLLLLSVVLVVVVQSTYMQ